MNIFFKLVSHLLRNFSKGIDTFVTVLFSSESIDFLTIVPELLLASILLSNLDPTWAFWGLPACGSSAAFVPAIVF